ncbi:MAG TPA: aminotransferase class V-fold PLP-dependent enzyme, partial [Actinomycetota bacterium]|nr:aminotransferase class V-fold PLP-dependent enzyme [Actinomycetota bacterium]
TVALMSAVSEAASTVAASLPNGRIVVGSREFHSNLFPWMNLERRGFEIVQVPDRDGVVSTDALANELDERVVLLAVSEVQSSNGYRVDIRPLADRCRQVGARLFVNLTQALGALRFDAEAIGADFVVAHGYKWLVGPRGAAWMHVREDRLAELQPLMPNWHAIPEPYADYYGGPFELAPGARKLDTSISWFPWVGARAALELISSLDREAVERRALELARAFREGARERGLTLVAEEVPSQTVAVLVDDPERVTAALKRRNVVGAVRAGSLRLGFHGFNTDEDVETALRVLDEAAD